MDLKSNGIVTLMDPGSSADSSHKNSGPNEAHTTSQTPIGAHRWEYERAKWIAKHRQTEPQHQQKDNYDSPSQTASTEVSSYAHNPMNMNLMKTEVNVNIDEVIGVLFSNRWDSGTNTHHGRFPSPVPLPLMVEILVDFWEAEGLDI